MRCEYGALLVMLLVVLAGCAGMPAAPTATPAPSAMPTRPAATPTPPQSAAEQLAWRADLQFMAEQLRTRHPRPFYRTAAVDFDRAVRDLDTAIPTLTRDQVVVGLIRIAAMIDGHTQLPVYQPGFGFHMFPLRLYWFSDGLFVIDAQAPYRGTIGARVVQIGDLDVESAARLLAPLAHHDNDSSARQVAPMFYLMPEVLIATGVAQPGRIELRVEQGDGARTTIAPAPIAIDTYLAWTGGRLVGLPQRDAPLFLSRRDAFWLAPLGDQQALYIQYNQVRRASQSGETIAAFAQRIAALLDEQHPRRVVLDMRNNNGGDNTTYAPLLDLLTRHALFKRPGALYTLIGRQTFSAATNFVAELEQAGVTTFAGEPTGGSPNLYGDTRPISLPHSRLQVIISSRYWQKSTPNDRRAAIEPQLALALTSRDYFAGRDRLLEAVLAQP